MSNRYTYGSNNRNASSPTHGRAATYNPNREQKQTSSAHHLPSNSIAATSNATLNDIETTRSDMRDILWQNAELLQSDPNYRKKVWRYMSKVFYGNQSTAYNFDNYKKCQLPTNSNLNQRNATQNADENNDPNQASSAGGLTHDVDILTKEKLGLLLDREETYSDFLINNNPNQVILMNKVRPKMERILEAYACANQNKFALSGAVQLCAVILTTFSDTENKVEKDSNSDQQDCCDTFFILQILTQIMRTYYLCDCKLMRDETLLLIDVLCVNEDKLVRQLNKLCIDVIDLSVFVVSWIGCLFVHHFEIEFVQRVIDLVLLEGPSVLIAIVYGILQFIKNDILQCDTHYDVFEKLAGNKLKNYLRKHEFITRVISKAQLLFTEENYKYVIKGREKKSWTDLLGLPGQRHFRINKGVGDKTKVKKAYQHWRRESRKNITNAYLGAQESSDDSSDNDHENEMDIHSSHQQSNSYNEMNDNNNNIQMMKDMEEKLQIANDTILRLQSTIDSNINNESQIPTSSTMIEHNESIVIHNEREIKHQKNNKTLCEILYTSSLGDEIYREPTQVVVTGTNNNINGQQVIEIREIQCRTENWTDSWKNAINSLTDASISMQGYLCKMTASKWNSRGTLDKIQRRWFVLRGNYMTYYKTNLHTQPKSDKCVNLLNYKVNPICHEKSKYAFELISTPKENIHKKNKNNIQKQKHLERTKFILIPDLDVNIERQKEIRDKWVKSLRLATKGAFLWDVLLNIPIHSNTPPMHSYRDRHNNNNNNDQEQQNQFTYNHNSVKSGPASFDYRKPVQQQQQHHQSTNSTNNSNSSQHNKHHSNSPKNTYNKRQYSGYKNKNKKRPIGGNTQDYPDYQSNQY